MTTQDQQLYLVFGGELDRLDDTKFTTPDELDVVGIFTTYDAAYDAWKDSAQRTVDNAHCRYFLVNIDEKINPQ